MVAELAAAVWLQSCTVKGIATVGRSDVIVADPIAACPRLWTPLPWTLYPRPCEPSVELVNVDALETLLEAGPSIVGR